LAAEVGKSIVSRVSGEAIVHVFLHRVRLVYGRDGGFKRRDGDGVELSASLLDGPARFEAAHRGQPIAVAHVEHGVLAANDRLGADGYGHVVETADFDAIKAGRSDADDGKGMAFDGELAANCLGLAAKLVLPKRIADDGAGRAAAAAIFIRGKKTAEERL
jgi:hypothetical protein